MNDMILAVSQTTANNINLMGYSQVERHRPLNPICVGSIPTAPAINTD